VAVNIVRRIEDGVKINNIIVSVSNKEGLDRLVPALIEINPSLVCYSTGGTYTALESILGAKAKTNLHQVSDYTGQPEMQGGLVKTLDFRIFLGVLSETYNEAHSADLSRTGSVKFDMLVVNLYPFSETIAKQGAGPEDARANIDIGGPCMVRASAKNFHRVAPVTDPADYVKIVDELSASKGIMSLRTRYELAKKAFAHTAEYDRAISEYLAKLSYEEMKGTYTIG
jgi:phosphoribosylaminoimidazolecarboxamide formyltransferase/IMP cyclohydrolase